MHEFAFCVSLASYKQTIILYSVQYSHVELKKTGKCIIKINTKKNTKTLRGAVSFLNANSNLLQLRIRFEYIDYDF